MLEEYKEININGKIIDSHIMNSEGDIPKNYKKTWSEEKSFYEPFWNFLKNDWDENISQSEILSQLKEPKKEQLERDCQGKIVKGFSFIIKQINYHFSYDQETQLNFQDTYNLFQNNLLEEIGWTARLNEKKVRIQLTKKNFFELYTASIKHKNECLNYLYDDLFVQLEKAETKEEIDLIEWKESAENLTFNTEETLDKKLTDVDVLGKETQAQKGQNAYMESTIMEVADLIFGAM